MNDRDIYLYMQLYDVVLIGTGQATGSLISPLLKMGMRVATVEGDRVGGSCVNWGCTPTKTLVASARAVHMARRGSDFGVEIDAFHVRYERVRERVNGMRMPATEGFRKWLEETTDFYPGWASFVDAHTLRITSERDEVTIRGELILVHTGTRARKPDIPGLDTVDWLDNRGVLDLTAVPDHLIVIGGSYIGLEFAQAFRRFGSEVTVLQRADHLVSREDYDVSDAVREVLEGEGIQVKTGVAVDRVAPAGTGLRLTCSHDGISESIDGTHLLVATGRLPNTDCLDLENAGVRVNRGGYIDVDDYCRTSVPHVFALGDVNGRGAFTHTSVHDGQVFLDWLHRSTARGASAVGSSSDLGSSRSDNNGRAISDRIPIHSMFIDPPLARVGMSEREARESGRNVLMATMPVSRINRAREKGETSGLVKMLVDADDRTILGTTIFGVGGDEIIGMIALSIQAKLPYTTLQHTVLPHPTVSELLPFILEGLAPLES